MTIGTRRSAILVGDSRKSPKIVPHLVEKIALVVTSPPYHNAISYDRHDQDSSSDYRVRHDISYFDEYLSLLSEVWGASYQMLRPGGYLAINVGTVLEAGYQYPVPQDIISCLIGSHEDWELYRSIQWNKVTAGVKRAGSVIRHKYPGYWYPNIMTEHIIIARKPGESIKNHHVPAEWWLPVWDLAPVPPGVIDHPAPFPEELPHRLIRMLTEKDDWVMDPFLGSGTTVKAAIDLGRKGLGFDTILSYALYAKARLAEPPAIRSRQLQIETVPEGKFRPGRKRPKGETRHGAGLRTKRK